MAVIEKFMVQLLIMRRASEVQTNKKHKKSESQQKTPHCDDVGVDYDDDDDDDGNGDGAECGLQIPWKINKLETSETEPEIM